MYIAAFRKNVTSSGYVVVIVASDVDIVAVAVNIVL